MSIHLDCSYSFNMKSSRSAYSKWMIFSSSYTLLIILLTEWSFAHGMEIENFTKYSEEINVVHNIKASAFYDEGKNDIHLNITWKNPPESTVAKWQILQTLQFEDDNEYCDRGNSRMQKTSPSNTTSVILEKEHYPNCTYRVEIVGELGYDMKAPHVIYTVPECVDNKCICHFLNSLPVGPDIMIEKISMDKIRIFWKIPEITTMNNVSTISFKVSQYDSAKEKLSLTRNITSWCLTRQCHEDIYLGMTIGTVYSVETWYADASNCKSDITPISYHALDVAESQMVYQVMVSFMFVIMFVCVLWLVWKRKCGWLRGIRGLRSASPSHLKRIDIASTDRSCKRVSFSFPMQYNNLYIQKENVENIDEYEVSYTQLQLGPQIGDGAFGQVFRARLPPYIIVAVKTLKQNASNEELEDFLLEIAMLKQIGRHPNIVTLLGCCTVRQPYCMIMEYIPCGDLLRYLHALRTYYEHKNKRFHFEHDDPYSRKECKETVSDESMIAPPSIPFNRLPSITETVYTELNSAGAIECVLEPRELQNFAVQIARGMRHLEHKQIVHRDLAARNVLIDENKILKISDFGLSRTGVYINSKQKKVPLRWMSIEAIRDNLYTSKSDVWAFGIVLWEIGTLGGFPYSTVSDTEILRFLLSGRRLEKPENCTAELYALMLRSWSSMDEQRPSFTELLEDLEAISSKRRVYVDFSQLNPVYMLPSKAQIGEDTSNSCNENLKF